MTIVTQQPIIDLPQPAPPRQRDARGRFAPGNRISSAGGKARAAKLSRRRRRAIARKGFRAMLRKHWAGDARAHARYWAEMGRFQYEVQAGALLPDGSRRPGSPLRTNALHPGPAQEWRARYYTDSLLWGSHRDVEFQP